MRSWPSPRLFVLTLVMVLCVGWPICEAQSPISSQPSSGAAPLSDGRVVKHSPMLLSGSAATAVNMVGQAIPDYADSVPGQASLPIVMMNAPQGALVLRAVLSGRVEHAHVGDLVIKLSNAESSDLLLWDRQGGANDAGLDDDIQSDADVMISERSIEDAFDGAVINQTWALEAYDLSSGNTGRLDYAQLWLYYASGSAAEPWIANYGVRAGGWADQDTFPRMLADVDGDGRDDLVGFGYRAVYVSLSTGDSLGTLTPWVDCYGPAAGGWVSQDIYPRCLGDVNGDGRADIVGFGNRAVYVSLSTGHSFGEPAPWIAAFGPSAGGWSDQNTFPRFLGDVNGDGLADIVGCGRAGAYVSLSSGTSFGPLRLWVTNFGAGAGGWTSQDMFPRCVADVDGDGMDDLVGFGNRAVYVSRSTGAGFTKPTSWVNCYGAQAGGWVNQSTYPRMVADMDGDGDADIIGFGAAGAYASHSLGNAYGRPWLWLAQFSPSVGGWASQSLYPRMLGDINGDGLADIVGCGHRATYVSLTD